VLIVLRTEPSAVVAVAPRRIIPAGQLAPTNPVTLTALTAAQTLLSTDADVATDAQANVLTDAGLLPGTLTYVATPRLFAAQIGPPRVPQMYVATPRLVAAPIGSPQVPPARPSADALRSRDSR
jgi:hypothetical protein